MSLRPGGPNARLEGNVWGRPKPALRPGTPSHAAAIEELKWTDAEFADYEQGRLPMGKTPDEWSFGDVDAGFKNAALVLDETFVTPNTSHQTLESRTAMAYWQNGKLYMHCSTQSVVQTVGVGRRDGSAPRAEGRRRHQQIHRRRIRQQGDRDDHVDDSRAAVEESSMRP